MSRQRRPVGETADVTLPSLADVVSSLRAMCPSAAVEPDVALGDLDVDSMDLLEWLYGVVEDHGLDVDEASLQRIDDETTVRELYEIVVGA
jgi:acyl carrier protein